jgi:hypothetical protein
LLTIGASGLVAAIGGSAGRFGLEFFGSLMSVTLCWNADDAAHNDELEEIKVNFKL